MSDKNTLSNCPYCNNKDLKNLFKKESRYAETFTLLKCKNCNLVFIGNPPGEADLKKYYGNEYFLQRSERGYNNYYSKETRKEIERVFKLNLKDVKFNKWLKNYKKNRSSESPLYSLDIGCAAGYFVNFMKSLAWKAEGIEIAPEASAYGRRKLKLSIETGDFLKKNYTRQFDLITLWASLEHLSEPFKVMEKVSELLKPGGLFIISTCRYGLLSKVRGKNWRFYNVPEHLFYFNPSLLKESGRKYGLKEYKSFSYGSTLTAKKGAGLFYRAAKKILDFSVKKLNQGDMIVFSWIKNKSD